jgi:hypothetical protein
LKVIAVSNKELTVTAHVQQIKTCKYGFICHIVFLFCVVVGVCYSTNFWGVFLFAFCFQFVFGLLLGCGVGAFSVTTMLVLSVVGVIHVEVSWLWNLLMEKILKQPNLFHTAQNVSRGLQARSTE